MPDTELALETIHFEAHERYDAVPFFPTRSDFEQAERHVAVDQHPAAVWHREAVRWRMANEGKVLDLVAIAEATLKALHPIA